MALFNPGIWYSIRPTAYPGQAVTVMFGNNSAFSGNALLQTRNIPNEDSQLFQFYPTSVSNSTFAIRCNSTTPYWYASVRQINGSSSSFMTMTYYSSFLDDPRLNYWNVTQTDGGSYQLSNSFYNSTTNFIYANTSITTFSEEFQGQGIVPNDWDNPYINIGGSPDSADSTQNAALGGLSVSNYNFDIVSTGIVVNDVSFASASLPLANPNISLPQSQPESGSSNGVKGSVVVIIVVPGLSLLLILVVLALSWRRWRRRRHRGAAMETKERRFLDLTPYVVLAAQDQEPQKLEIEGELVGSPGGQEFCGTQGDHGHELVGDVAAYESQEPHESQGGEELDGVSAARELPAFALHRELYGSPTEYELHGTPTQRPEVRERSRISTRIDEWLSESGASTITRGKAQGMCKSQGRMFGMDGSLSPIGYQNFDHRTPDDDPDYR